MKDALQKKLYEMEKENPSLRSIEPSLGERVYFKTRGFLNKVEKVNQESSLVSKDLIEPYKDINHPDHYLYILFWQAERGNCWEQIKTTLEILNLKGIRIKQDTLEKLRNFQLNILIK